MKKLLLALLVWMFALPALADHDYDTRRLLTYKSWFVERVHSRKSGSTWCNAGTENSHGKRFLVTGYNNGTLKIFVMDDSWNLVKESVQFTVRIGRKDWNVYGQTEGVGIFADLDNADKSARFLHDLARGNSVRFYNGAGTNFASFSLSGSRRAIDAFFSCWKSI